MHIKRVFQIFIFIWPGNPQAQKSHFHQKELLATCISVIYFGYSSTIRKDSTSIKKSRRNYITIWTICYKPFFPFHCTSLHFTCAQWASRWTKPPNMTHSYILYTSFLFKISKKVVLKVEKCTNCSNMTIFVISISMLKPRIFLIFCQNVSAKVPRK